MRPVIFFIVLIMFSPLLHSMELPWLHAAIKAADIAKVQELITSKVANVNDCSSSGDTPLYYALHYPSIINTTIVLYLIQAGADNSLNPKELDTPLCVGIINHQYEVVQALLEHKAHVNAICDFNTGETPLLIAAAGGDVRMINYLLQEEANPEATSYKNFSALHALVGAEIEAPSSDPAAIIESCKALIAAKVPLNVRDTTHGNTALHFAIKGLSYNNKEGDYYQSSHDELLLTIIQLLMQAGADIHMSDQHNNTPLITAIKKNKRCVICLYNKSDSLRKKDDMPVLVRYGDDTVRTVIWALITAGADLNHTNKKGYTALDYAVRTRQNYVLKALINKGIQQKYDKNSRITPLGYALLNKDMVTVGLLLKASVPPPNAPVLNSDSLISLAVKGAFKDTISAYDFEQLLLHNIAPSIFFDTLVDRYGFNVEAQFYVTKKTPLPALDDIQVIRTYLLSDMLSNRDLIYEAGNAGAVRKFLSDSYDKRFALICVPLRRSKR